MRSRYAAFALGDADYLLYSWSPDYRPDTLQLEPQARWIGLEILNSESGQQQATVEFEASCLVAGEVSAMRERSDFVLRQGRWLYTRGDQLRASFVPWKPARNQACPCGSGVKFKRCCALP